MVPEIASLAHLHCDSLLFSPKWTRYQRLPSLPGSKPFSKPADLSLMHAETLPFAPAPILPPSSLLTLYEQRRGLSELERASATLASAVEYLVSEQLAGRRHPLSANRDAIAILAGAGRDLLSVERRQPAKQSIAAWLRGASLYRARRHHFPDTPDALVL